MQSRQQFGILCVALLLGQAAHEAAVAADPRPVLKLVVDYGDGVELHFRELPWRPGMTVLDALAGAAKRTRGIKFVQRGRGANAMITEIDGLENDAGGKNWLFSINGKTAEVGAGAFQLEAGDTVLWEFKAYDYN